MLYHILGRTGLSSGIYGCCRAFSKQEAERHGLQPYSKSQFGSRVILPGTGTEYEDGYEIKWVSMRNVVLDEVGPTVEELTRYNQVSSLLPPEFPTNRKIFADR